MNTIFNRHAVPVQDRPAIRALVETGAPPPEALARELADGNYRTLLAELMAWMSRGLPHRFSANTTDEQLFNRYLEGDEEAFDQIRSRRGPMVAEFLQNLGAPGLSDIVFDALSERKSPTLQVRALLLKLAERLARESGAVAPVTDNAPRREVQALLAAGHSVESAAAELGIPVTTARWRVR